MSSEKPDAYGGGKYDPPSKAEHTDKGEHTEYERLRIILDSLEIGALRYYLDKTDTAEKAKRFTELSSKLVPLCREFWRAELGITLAGCPPGYNDCDGVCVPYNC